MTYVFVLSTVLLGLYGQLVLKWQMTALGPAPQASSELLAYMWRALTNVWVISSVAAAFLGMVTWMAAISRMPLSQAYPFISLSFPLIAISSWIAFGEPLTPAKVAGVLLILLGLVVGHL